VLTAGVDVAAEPRGTALAIVEWADNTARLAELTLNVADDVIVEAAIRADKIGIDCALGWPIEFVDFVVDHAKTDTPPSPVDGGMEWRRRLAYRETDRHIRARTGRWPLSVSTDRLGLTAMRTAGLLARMAASGIDVDRSGFGDVVEVYPGATLRWWGCDTQGYRTARAPRETLLASLQQRAPWLEVALFADMMVSSADAFDAVIAALCARAAALGLVERPPDQIVERARVEGWIAFPTGPLGDLLQPTH